MFENKESKAHEVTKLIIFRLVKNIRMYFGEREIPHNFKTLLMINYYQISK